MLLFALFFYLMFPPYFDTGREVTEVHRSVDGAVWNYRHKLVGPALQFCVVSVAQSLPFFLSFAILA